MSEAIKHLLNPEAVVIVGATEGEHRIGGRVLHYILRAGFKGTVYPVNPGRDTVQGLKAYRQIEDIPGSADCAIFAVPAAAVIPSLRACAAKGVKAVIMFSAGFAELGEEGRAMQDELVSVARETGMRILGPNCLGAFNAHSGLMGTFSSNIIDKTPVPGKVGIVSQSGAFGAHLYSLCDERGIGISYWVTTGNEADITIAECIAFMASEPAVNTIMVYAEGINDPEGLAAALDLARANRKPVIFVKVGRTDAGAKAAASHTASLAVSDTACDAFLKRHGAYRAETTDEMVECAYACQPGVFPSGDKIGLVSISGGAGVQMADRCDAEGLTVPEFPKDLQVELKAMLPLAATTNPVDMTALVVEKPELMIMTFQMVSDRAGCDAISAFLTPIAARQEVLDGLTDWSRGLGGRMPVCLCAPIPQEVRRPYEEAGILVFETPDKAVRACGILRRFALLFDGAEKSEPPAAPEGAEHISEEPLNEAEAKAVLRSWGVDTVAESLATTVDEAVAAAAAIDGPAALKIASADIAHKTEIGGVLLNVEGMDAVRAAFDTLMERGRTARPDARIDGVIVSEMASGGVEVVIGVQNDTTFGPVVMFGLGGVFVEILKDVSFRLAPFGVEEARDMIAGIKGAKILQGARGGKPADVEALARTLAHISVFAAANADRLETLDLNPVLVREEGVLALDALIVPRSEP